MTKKEHLHTLYNQYSDFKNSPLYMDGANSLVLGHGNTESPIVFIGEAPGAEEDRLKIPFIGRTGKVLTHTIETLGFSREEIFITNIVKCRPPLNRTPTAEEIKIGKELVLEKELEIINPKIIVTLGASSFSGLIEQPVFMSKMRGIIYQHGPYSIFPTFHPAYILRNRSMFPIFLEDIKKAFELSGLIK